MSILCKFAVAVDACYAYNHIDITICLVCRYVGQVDYQTTPEELRAHFAPCGTLNKVTIICDKFTGVSKGWVLLFYATAHAWGS